MAAIFEAAEKHRRLLLAGDREAASHLVHAYGTAWERANLELQGVLRKLEAAVAAGEDVSPAWLYQQRRMEAALGELEAGMRAFVDDAEVTIRDQQAAAVDAAQAHAHEQVAAALAEAPAGVGVVGDFTRMPKEALDHLVGTLADGSPLRTLLRQLPGEAGEAFAQALVAGVARGENPRRIAAEVRRAMGGNLARALTIARTEVLRSYRESTRLGYAANADIVKGWTWHSALQPRRTCAACWAMHGTVHPVDQRLDGHPNCRCVMVPLTRSWAELGAPPGTPDTTPPIARGPDLFDQLSEADQRAILGPAKLKAYKAGDIQLTDLVGRRSSDAWGTMRHERGLAAAARDARRDRTIPKAKAAKRGRADRHRVDTPVELPPAVRDDLERLGAPLEEVPMPADLARAVRSVDTRARVVDTAAREGLEVGDLEDALAQVPDLKEVVREDARRTRNQAQAWLDQNAEGGRLRKPPAAQRRTGSDGRVRMARDGGGEWDWLETLDEAELKRLRRFWTGAPNGMGVDVLEQAMEHHLGLTGDAAIRAWLEQNRLVDAAGALARGKLPSGRGYGNLVVDDLAPTLTQDGYDVARLMGADDLDAAVHVAKVQADQAAEFAARAFQPARLGPDPYRMSQYAYEAELRELEYDLTLIGDHRRTLERLEELIPEGLDDQLDPLPPDQLHQAVVALARKAGLV